MPINSTNMKFLLQCITCCPIPSPFSPPSTPFTPSSSSSPTSSETDTLFLPRSPTDKNRRRKKPTTRFDVVVEWRPSLYAISEEGVGKRKSGEEKRVSEKRERRNYRWELESLSSVHHHVYRFGDEQTPTIVQALIPTPFMC